MRGKMFSDKWLKAKRYYLMAKNKHLNYGHRHQAIQIIEMFFVYLFTGIPPGYYLQANMGVNQCSYLFGFLNQKKYIKKVYKINDRLYHRSSMNKMIEKAIFTSYGLPTPRLLGFYSILRGRDINGCRLKSIEDLIDMLRDINVEKVCLKPTSSFGGKGVKIVTIIKDNESIYLYDNKTMERKLADIYLSEYFETINMHVNEGVIIEEFLDQHESFSKYNISSVNTVRVMVFLSENISDSVFGAFLRVGRAGDVVDNGTSGGVMVRINHNTGKLGYGCFSSLTNDRFISHPDSQVPFVGDFLPQWDEIKKLAIDVVCMFPGIHYAGLDIALSINGPVVIEMNVQPDYVDFALIDVPSKHVFSGNI